MLAADWVHDLIGPAALLVLGWLLTQMSKLRRENTDQHAEGRALVQTVVDGLHNLSGKVDGVDEKVQGVGERLDDHIADHEESKKYWKRKDDRVA